MPLLLAGRRRASNVCIQTNIILGHRRGGEAFLEHIANFLPRQMRRARDGLHGFVDAGDDEAGDPVVDHFRDRAVIPGDHRRAAGHRLDHDEAEGFRPVDREKQRGGIAQEIGFLVVADLADELDAWVSSIGLTFS